MAGLIGILAVVALAMWIASRSKRRADSPVIDQEELEAAERDLADDGAPRAFDAQDDDDDWGPGAPSR